MFSRQKAIEYAFLWWNGRNPSFYNFDNIGGDCTNFVSQCLYYGGIEMNFNYLGWFYDSINFRSPSWSGVEEFFDFATKNSGVGVRAKQTTIESIEVGDVVQLMGKYQAQFHHTLLVTKIGQNLDYDNIFLTGHTVDVKNIPLSSYNPKQVRFLKILN